MQYLRARFFRQKFKSIGFLIACLGAPGPAMASSPDPQVVLQALENPESLLSISPVISYLKNEFEDLNLELVSQDAAGSEVFAARLQASQQQNFLKYLEKTKEILKVYRTASLEVSEKLLAEFRASLERDLKAGNAGIPVDLLFFAEGVVRKDLEALQKFLALQEKGVPKPPLKAITTLEIARLLARASKAKPLGEWIADAPAATWQDNCRMEVLGKEIKPGVPLRLPQGLGFVTVAKFCKEGASFYKKLEVRSPAMRLDVGALKLQGPTLAGGILPQSFWKSFVSKYKSVGILHLESVPQEQKFVLSYENAQGLQLKSQPFEFKKSTWGFDVFPKNEFKNYLARLANGSSHSSASAVLERTSPKSVVQESKPKFKIEGIFEVNQAMGRLRTLQVNNGKYRKGVFLGGGLAAHLGDIVLETTGGVVNSNAKNVEDGQEDVYEPRNAPWVMPSVLYKCVWNGESVLGFSAQVRGGLSYFYIKEPLYSRKLKATQGLLFGGGFGTEKMFANGASLGLGADIRLPFDAKASYFLSLSGKLGFAF